MPDRLILKIVLATILACLFLNASKAGAQSGIAVPENVVERQTDVYSEGTRLTAHIFTPASAEEGDKLPAVIMAQGWGGTQDSLFRDAVEFAQAGYFVATFDFRGWGESDSRVILSEPMPGVDEINFTAEVRAIREVIDPMDMGMDWLNMVHWIHGEPMVDRRNIGLWGSSLAGGLAVYAASHDQRVKAIHTQVTGLLDGRIASLNPESAQISTARAAGEAGYPEPGADFQGLTGYPIPARFIPYVPSEDFKRNKRIALQIVLAENEEYGTNPQAIQLHEEYSGPKNLAIVSDITHYGIYSDGRDEAFSLALSWFDQHLKASSE